MYRLIFLFLLPGLLLFAEEKVEEPWFIGSLLADPGLTVPRGHTNYQPYLFNTQSRHDGENRWNINPQLLITWGVAHFMDFKFISQAFYNTQGDASFFRQGDFSFILGLQAMRSDHRWWKPNLRIIFEETFPTGKYQRLSPGKKGVDSTGNGSYATSMGLYFQKKWHFKAAHWLRARLNLKYTLPAPVHVEGLNTYGGGFGTNGKVYPGQTFFGIFAFEYSFTRNWVFALDVTGSYVTKTRFSGKPGIDDKGKEASVTIGSGTQWTLAPAIEYNWSQKLGMIAGIWYSVSSHNIPSFISYVISVNYYH